MSAVYVSMTVDWEGKHFGNVGDLIGMRQEIENALGVPIPFTHYVCPSYWLNDSKLAKPEEKVMSACADIDEIGLHVHCRKELVEYADLSLLLDTATNLGDSSGHGVPLGVYNQSKIEQILGKARELLNENLTGADVPGFRCGAWMASDGVLKALMACGFRYDASALPPVIFSQGYSQGNDGDGKDTTGDGNDKFTSTILKLWGYAPQSDAHVSNALSLRWNARKAITPRTVPFKIFDSSRSLIEMPNNLGLCDYASKNFMIGAFETIANTSAYASEPLFVNLGCHQEGDKNYKQRLVDFFQDRAFQIKSLLDAGRIHFSTVLEASKAADLYMVD